MIEIKDIYKKEKQEYICKEIKKFMMQSKELSAYIKNDGADFEAQLIFEPFIILVTYKLNGYNSKLFVKYENMFKEMTHFQIEEGNATPSIIKCVEKRLAEFQQDVEFDTTGQAALETIKGLAPRAKIKLSKFERIVA